MTCLDRRSPIRRSSPPRRSPIPRRQSPIRRELPKRERERSPIVRESREPLPKRSDSPPRRRQRIIPRYQSKFKINSFQYKIRGDVETIRPSGFSITARDVTLLQTFALLNYL